MTAENTTITSDNFSVDKYGNMSCNNANITGGIINLNSAYDVPKIILTSPVSPNAKMQISSGTIRAINNYGEVRFFLYGNMGMLGLQDSSFGSMIVGPSAVLIKDTLENEVITLNKNTDGNITCVSLTQTSKEENKKNFEKLLNGLDIIKATEIYKYNMKSQEDKGKKHIGFVIGDNYKYSEEITSEDNDGVDTYSMVSVAYKAIQEQQEQIEQLQEEIKKLKGEK